MKENIYIHVLLVYVEPLGRTGISQISLLYVCIYFSTYVRMVYVCMYAYICVAMYVCTYVCLVIMHLTFS